MQIQGLAQNVSPQFAAHIQAVRLFTRDFQEFNLLIRGEESSDRMIAWATLDFLSDFNGTPPFTTLSLEDLFARGLQSFAVRGTVVTLIQSLMLVHARNKLPFNDGGITGVMNDYFGELSAMIGLFQSSYEQNKAKIKITMNIEQLLDTAPSSVHSDYLTLSTLGYYA